MNFTTRDARFTERNDGSSVLSNAVGPGVGVDDDGPWLDHWAGHEPDRGFIAKRDRSGAWSMISVA